MPTKVFGIGLGKTGTTSLARAMRLLGYTAKHGIRSADELADCDFANDIGVAWRYRFLDAVFPAAKFILTVRDLTSWLRSCEDFGRPRGNRGPLRRLETRFMTYGCVGFHRDKYAAAHERHRREVRDYFAGRPGTLLELDIVAGEGWEKLCPFVGAPVPARPFPHLRRTARPDPARRDPAR